ncbi:glycoside hydrolase superfamily [Echria macrotheca]|uniref:Beta-xylanase n=1 Tax=Echria macrotheca TaxID=438768 RepID=A0AAJ0FD99_9PEZI|nr:glycoside hydrolase superfamily [Echria macrotheca]
MLINFISLGLLLVSAATTGVSAQQNKPGSSSGTGTQAKADQGLNALMVAAGKLYMGTAIETNNFNDAAYMAIANDRNEFGLYVPENSQKWEEIQPAVNTFSFAAPDSIDALAKKNGQMFRCHTLTWHSQLPTFVANGTWTKDTLSALITTHITNIVTHYAGSCYAWDVVNEALNDNGTFRSSVFFRTMGTDFLPLSFTVASKADPNAKLYYNDFNLETLPRKADAAVALVKLVQAAGAPIHGIGFQAHFRVGQTPNTTSLVALQNRFVALGLDTTFSELDIAHTSLPPNSTAIERQAQDYVGVVAACLAVQRCVGITLWQFSDKYSWIPTTFPGLGDACLWTANFTKKPAYSSVASFLAGKAAATPGPNASGRPGGGVQSTPTSTAFSAASPAFAMSGGGAKGLMLCKSVLLSVFVVVLLSW